MLLNILINNIFLILQECNLQNCADVSTMYTSEKTISNMINSLSHNFTVLSRQFYNNLVVFNPDKSSFIILDGDDEPQTGLVRGSKTHKINQQEKVLGFNIDNKLSFPTRLVNITKNANSKFIALMRVSFFFCINKDVLDKKFCWSNKQKPIPTDNFMKYKMKTNLNKIILEIL